MNGLAAAACVAFGGAIGALLRFAINTAFLARGLTAFPWATFAINLSGSLAIGIVLGLAETRAGLNPYARLFLATGVLGGYTTFSAFAFETLALGRDGMVLPAALYAGGSLVLGVAAAYAGMVLTRALVA